VGGRKVRLDRKEEWSKQGLLKGGLQRAGKACAGPILLAGGPGSHERRRSGVLARMARACWPSTGMCRAARLCWFHRRRVHRGTARPMVWRLPSAGGRVPTQHRGTGSQRLFRPSVNPASLGRSDVSQ